MWDQSNIHAVSHYDRFRITAEPHADGETDYRLSIGDYRVVPGERDAGDAMGRYDLKAIDLVI